MNLLKLIALRSMDADPIFKNEYYVLLLLFLIVLLPYVSSLQTSWHLDDYPNITQNERLHISEIAFRSVKNSLFAHPNGKGELYRPLPCLTFGLNWYWGKDQVFGYHAVNVFVHFITTCFLFLTISKLFLSPNLQDKYSSKTFFFVALLGTVFWAMNPIQTQAVTYIVQRMATMAAMFSIMSIFFFVCGRLKKNEHRIRLFYFLGCLVCFGLALGSKENTVMLPFSILLVEVIFFQSSITMREKNSVYLFGIGIGWVVLVFGAILFVKKNIFFFLSGYQNRSFSIWERLLTEFRILLFYLSQIFYPIPSRLSIDHDVTLSTSIFTPWTTLPAICIIIFLIGFSIWQIRKRPLFSFGILFYFVNHIVESTVLPLELVFEHRNYLPTLFLFFPLAVGIHRLLQYYEKKRIMYWIISVFVCFFIMGFGIGTYIRNMDWGTERSLWEDALKKSPGRARPAYNLAKHHYRRIGDYDRALFLYEKSYFLQAPLPKYSKALSLNGMAGIYYLKQDFPKVIELCRKALQINPKFHNAEYNILLAYLSMKHWGGASKQLDTLQKKYPSELFYHYMQGVMQIRLNKSYEAIPYFQQVLKQRPNDQRTLVHLSKALSLTGAYERAEWFLRRAHGLYPKDITIYLHLMENSIRVHDDKKLEQLVDEMFDSFPVQKIGSAMKQQDTVLFSVPYSTKLIIPIIANKLRERAGAFTATED